MINAALEAEYNVRAAIPGHAAFFEDWILRSAQTRARLAGRLDVPYGTRAEEVMDVFCPARAKEAPIHVFIHGGYWQGRDKSEFSFVAESLVARGAVVVVPNYALCPAVSLDEIVREMRQLISWLWMNGRGLGGDPERIHVSGHSAGGHLTAMLMATDWPEFDPELPETVVHSGLSISGIFDLEPLRHTSINEAVGMDADCAERNSPLHMTPTAPGPFAIAAGEKESRAFHDQSNAMAKRWRARGMTVRRFDLKDCHHLRAVETLADPDTPLFAEAVRLMGL